jgi:formamidopyrimidine-DNA glycosylase
LPELPEVELVRRALLPVMAGARFVEVVTHRRDLRVPFPRRFASRLGGQTVRALSRRGKYLIAELSSGDLLVMHLGMSGSFRVQDDASRMQAHDHVVFRMSSGSTIVFNDPRRFGSMLLVSLGDRSGHRTLGTLGPEPLGHDFDADALARACAGKRTSLKAALSDQRVVAGLGNIYVCEALHRARLSPRRRAGSIATTAGAPREAAYRMAAAVKKTLADAIARATSPRAGDRFRVYDRAGERCLRPGCTGVIRRIVQAGRSTFFCPVCQK